MKCGSLSRRCLFGGTILAAGLVCQPANAQIFNLAYSYGRVQTSDGSYNTFIGPGNWYISVTSMDGTQTANNWGQTTSIGSSTSSTGQGWAQGLDWYAYFYVTANGTATASWDFTGDQTYGSSYSGVWVWQNYIGGPVVYSKSWDGGIGSATFNLQAGQLYVVQAFSVASMGAGSSYAVLTIPAPGVAALMGVAGITAFRRRRNC